MLDNVLLQDVVGHAKRLALWIEVFLLQVVTIVTVQVADVTYSNRKPGDLWETYYLWQKVTFLAKQPTHNICTKLVAKLNHPLFMTK